ncbi:MAG: undecaprenyl/decaprenyl-phosphate alpha-N-acetylglucosaminyl 1-phosphate transferase [Planctomycetes bacterium]|nr:undecaprenyl/decaprenyl-phosphate alpha-N-acetylglucosaminyl 1-phosphate transferase [Planctomycetota bacterium]
MSGVSGAGLAAMGVALATTFVLSASLARLAPRWAPAGLLDRPRPDRWHAGRAVPRVGGVALVVGVLAPVAWLAPHDTFYWGLVLGGGAAFAVGMADDLVRLGPAHKLAGAAFAACLLVVNDVTLDLSAWPWAVAPATIGWYLLVSTAFNLLDNMDGLAAGTAAIAGVVTWAFALERPEGTSVEVVSAAVVGASLGFLALNRPPARVFMGDSGAWFLGMVLAASAAHGTWRQGAGVVATLAVPALVLALPLFDAAFVALTRGLSGRPLTRGGTDHASHRLVGLGTSEGRALGLLWGLSALLGGAAWLTRGTGGLVVAAALGVALVGLAAVALVLAGRELADGLPEWCAPAGLLLADLVLLWAAHVGAWAVRFGGIPEDYSQVLARCLPVFLGAKIPFLVRAGFYRGPRSVTIAALADLALTVALGTLVALLLVALAWRLEDVPRSVLALDGLLSFVLLAAARLAAASLRRALGRRAPTGP